MKRTFGTGAFIAIIRGWSGAHSSFEIVDSVIAVAPKSFAAILYNYVSYHAKVDYSAHQQGQNYSSHIRKAVPPSPKLCNAFET